MNAQLMKRIGLGLLILLIGGGLIYALRPLPAGVDVAIIGKGEMRVTVDEEGRTRIKDIYVISAPIAGRVSRNPLHVGDDVIAGETEAAVILPMAPPLLDLRARTELEALVSAAQSAIRIAEGELTQAKSESAMATLDLKRTRELARKGFAAERVLDRAQTEADVRAAAVARAQSAVKVRQDELRSAQARLISAAEPDRPDKPVSPVSVKAPASGKVLRLLTESEAPVAQGTPLVEIGDPANLDVVVDLLSTDAVKVEPGAEVIVEGWGGAETLAAKVRSVEPMGFTKVSALGIDEQRVRAMLDLTGPAAERSRLGHDFRVFVRILVWHAPDALRVPLGALFRDGDRWAVFTLAADRAQLRHIEIGHRNADFAEVLSGLNAGDRIVLHPSDRVTDGATVAPRE